ncbi:hypothetical protein SAMN06296416_10717 [Pseudoxanthomonas wuyuanensis]|uniref:Uncharacterized protein n=2 Tax=Pseudoxanthomonas wuyuanensis TaxID=1073196 RepID=A0A286D9K4_9GAMM|nr:hypothetical protein SAMN06296416_10717 [Pseudoxanthomonas wuyuanensis]
MFDVEHALGMYALGYCTLLAESIYDKSALAPLMPVIESCHIYLIGYVPRITLEIARQDGDGIHLTYSVLGNEHTLAYPVPEGYVLKEEEDRYCLEDSAGEAYWLNPDEVQQRLSRETGGIDFNVKYIGQAYGHDGSRNALDRLLKHETLQRISLLGIPDGYRLAVLLLSIQPSNQLYTVFNPFAKNKDEDGERVKSGLDKLYNTSEAERTTLYEASLIRYFYPEYNKEFKDSFPSTNLKVLKDCYSKDFSALVAEICIDELPFRLRSETVEPRNYHIIRHDLHETADRRMFFGL